MYLATTKSAGKTTAELRAEVIEQAKGFVLSCGETPENAAKLARIFDGPNAPCVLKFPELHIAHVNSKADEMGILCDPLVGHIDVNPSVGQPYQIRLRPETDGCPQHQFLVAIKRLGRPQVGKTEGLPLFWSYQLVVLNTVGEQPLVLALDLNSDGETLDMDFSRRLYFVRRTAADGSLVTQNRLATLGGTTNLPGVLLCVAQAEAFPIHEARPNRPTRQERFAANAARGRQAPSLVGAMPYATATMGAGTDGISENPFSDSD